MNDSLEELKDFADQYVRIEANGNKYKIPKKHWDTFELFFKKTEGPVVESSRPVVLNFSKGGE